MEWKSADEFQAALQKRERAQKESNGANWEYDFASAAVTEASDAKKQTVTLRYTFLPAMCNAWGYGHGGVQTMILDHAMASVIRNQSDHDVVLTADLQIHFLRVVRIDEPFHVRVKLERLGRSLAVMSAVAWSLDSEENCTIATGTYVLKSSDIGEIKNGTVHNQ